MRRRTRLGMPVFLHLIGFFHGLVNDLREFAVSGCTDSCLGDGVIQIYPPPSHRNCACWSKAGSEDCGVELGIGETGMALLSIGAGC